MPTDEKFKAFVEWKRPKNTSATENLNKWKQTQGNGRFKASNNGQVKSWRNSQHDGFKSKKGKNNSEKGVTLPTLALKVMRRLRTKLTCVAMMCMTKQLSLIVMTMMRDRMTEY